MAAVPYQVPLFPGTRPVGAVLVNAPSEEEGPAAAATITPPAPAPSSAATKAPSSSARRPFRPPCFPELAETVARRVEGATKEAGREIGPERRAIGPSIEVP